MGSKRRSAGLLLLSSCLGLLTPALAASADDGVAAKEALVLKFPRSGASMPATGPDSRPAVAATVKSNAGRSVDPRLTEDSLNLHASKITERATPGGDPEEAVRVIDLDTDVRLALQDGPMTASAERAVVTVRYQDASRTTIESVTVELSGGVQGEFDGIGASADTLTLYFRPSAQSNAAKPRPTHWTVRGRARLRGRDFLARADRVEMARDDDDSQQSLVVKLEGHAAFKYAGKGWMAAGRIEFRPYVNILRLVGAQPMRK